MLYEALELTFLEIVAVDFPNGFVGLPNPIGESVVPVVAAIFGFAVIPEIVE